MQNLLALSHDSSSKLILTKSYCTLIGKNATALLLHICSSLEQESSIVMDGRIWHRQEWEHIQHHACLSHKGLRKARKILLEEGLIEIQYEGEFSEKTAYWTIIKDKLLRFWQFAEALRAAHRPDGKTLFVWQEWSAKNPSIVAEFRHLWPRLNDYRPTPKSNLRIIKRPEQAELAEANKQPKQELCRYVEFWNNLPHVPKCKKGMKSYKMAKAFFSAHRHYKAGECREFPLTEDMRKKYRLDKTNGRSEKATRSDEEMKRHIEQAALAYNPNYSPINKSWLGNLPKFLYRSGGYTHAGTKSPFLEFVAFAPKPVENESYDTIIKNADDWQLEIVEIIRVIYFRANGRNEDAEFSLQELKRALGIANRIAAKYAEVPINTVSILGNHFPDYSAFMEWWKNYMEDHIWEGMPLTALDISKDLWRRFVDFASQDIGYHILTGDRV